MCVFFCSRCNVANRSSDANHETHIGKSTIVLHQSFIEQYFVKGMDAGTSESAIGFSNNCWLCSRTRNHVVIFNPRKKRRLVS